MENDSRPVIAVTMGDPAGIGPEVMVKALAAGEVYELCRPLVIGEGSIIQKTLEFTGIKARINRVKSPHEAQFRPGWIDLIDLHNLDERQVVMGCISAACGKASLEYIYQAAGMAMRREAAAIVTAPINKEATRLAGLGELGHLEILARYTGVTQYATMLASGSLRTVHLTTHYSLKEALTYITRQRISARIELISRSFQEWGLQHPRIAVAALNPHGGEGGILGREEIDEVLPAVREAIANGIDARGPFPADTVFVRAIAGEFDVVLALYHDQGHIPVKVYGFEKSYSAALGLPFIRTSVDHGTAFDIAGKGIAQSVSMVEAIRAAVALCSNKLP
jgi:4-phospho-D-threonate 3-dehydrogenase / 4-phospho-D-erythronate 3-dehydrogenase